MSLRLRLALAFAGLAALVSGGIGLAVYDRAADERATQARQGAVSRLRTVAPLIDVGAQRRPADVVVLDRPAPIGGGFRPYQRRIPRDLQDQVAAGNGRIYSAIVPPGADGEQTLVMAGVELPSTGQGTGYAYVVQPFARDEGELRSLRATLVQISLGAAGLGALLGIAAATVISRPLRRTAAVARRLGRGDLQARTRLRRNDEISQVGRALDDMADALGRRIAQLDRAAERERRFSADVAHELRTPITGLVAAASLLPDSDGGRMVRERASALAHLVEDLLEVMRLEGKREEPRRELFDLVRLVRDVAAARAPDARLVGVERLTVVSDPRRIERVLANLLDNAVRHGRAPVTITMRADGSVEVRDSGEGFGRFLERAGDRFAMASADRGGGTGLGLAIARGQARVLGGALELADRGGASITLRLPADALVVA